MQVIFFKETAIENFNAGYKARADIDYIMTKRGSKSIDVSFAYADIDKIRKAFGYLSLAFKLLFIPKGTALLVQYPCRQISTLLSKLARGKKIIYLIHDLEGLRRQDEEQQRRDIATLDKAYKIKALHGKERHAAVFTPLKDEYDIRKTIAKLCEIYDGAAPTINPADIDEQEK